MTATRSRLPNRRPSITETLVTGGQEFSVTIGFSPEDGSPRELFMGGAKEGRLLNSLLADSAVLVSIALQHDISAEALAKSMGRMPAGPVAPADLDRAPGRRVPASPIGAALDLVARSEPGSTLA